MACVSLERRARSRWLRTVSRRLSPTISNSTTPCSCGDALGERPIRSSPISRAVCAHAALHVRSFGSRRCPVGARRRTRRRAKLRVRWVRSRYLRRARRRERFSVRLEETCAKDAGRPDRFLRSRRRWPRRSLSPSCSAKARRVPSKTSLYSRPPRRPGAFAHATHLRPELHEEITRVLDHEASLRTRLRAFVGSCRGVARASDIVTDLSHGLHRRQQ